MKGQGVFMDPALLAMLLMALFGLGVVLWDRWSQKHKGHDKK